MLGFFFFSLLCAMGGLFFNVTLGRRVAKGVRAIAAVAYLFFLIGLGAVFRMFSTALKACPTAGG